MADKIAGATGSRASHHRPARGVRQAAPDIRRLLAALARPARQAQNCSLSLPSCSTAAMSLSNINRHRVTRPLPGGSVAWAQTAVALAGELLDACGWQYQRSARPPLPRSAQPSAGGAPCRNCATTALPPSRPP
jgi:hypothetical protein